MTKKIFILSLFCILSIGAMADDYSYLTFEDTSGNLTSVSVSSGVTLSISGTTLTVGSNSFTLSDLTKMYFTTTDETTETPTGISEVMKADLDEAVEIYDLNGHKVMRDEMAQGVYIIKTKNGAYKLNVK